MASRAHCVLCAALFSPGGLFSLGCFRGQVSVAGVNRTFFSQAGCCTQECGGPGHLLTGQVGPKGSAGPPHGALGLVVA